jgi:hypothetical protein
MQKVVGSNPISRFRKGLHLQVFFVGAVGFSTTARIGIGQSATRSPDASSPMPGRCSCQPTLTKSSGFQVWS